MTDPIQSAVDVLGPSGTIAVAASAIVVGMKTLAYLARLWSWYVYRNDEREGRPSQPPPELPPSLGALIILLAGSALAMSEPVARVAMEQSRPVLVSETATAQAALAANAEQPKKKDPKPSGKCGSGCSGSPPNCKCPTRSERATKISEVPTSILGDEHPWVPDSIQAFEDKPRS